MDILNIVNTIVVVIGIPTIIGCCIYVGRKLQILDTLETTGEKVKHNIKVISDFLTKNSILKFDPSELKSYSPLGTNARRRKVY